LAEESTADIPDDCSIPSVSSDAQHEDDMVPDLTIEQLLCTPTTHNDKDAADSTLAWTALAAILGSPAPTSVAKKGPIKERVNLLEDFNMTDMMPEIDENSVAAEDDAEIDLNELDDANEEINVQPNEVVVEGDKESADNVLAWSALGMLLGTPAPKSVSKKSKKERRESAQKLWAEEDQLDDNQLDTIPSIDHDDIVTIPSILPDSTSTMQKWFIEQGVDSIDDDDHSIPSLSKMTSLSNTSFDENEEPSSPSTSCSGFETPPVKEVSNEVFAWSALAAFMGQPAPKAVLTPKSRRKKARDLWSDESDADLDDLPFEISTVQ
jgi:hypothetical protein